ncbi:hypothetical protein HMPREF0973_00098 [Prevotella veroralis F0319]|uniref:Uncharacterized protein n=1 Tax=Prevotella veroralis F0319 TaxID=649761 RepID=C9MKJ0_9BACT|nr:hypothetical protein HMPREF0973_00098 [Prevotella veroralis F0319]
MRTDEGVCPYCEASPPPPLPMERGVDGIIFHRTNSSFTCQPVHSSTPTNHTLEVKQELWGGHPLLRRGLGRL